MHLRTLTHLTCASLTCSMLLRAVPPTTYNAKATKGPLGHMLAWLELDQPTREDHFSWRTRHLPLADRKRCREWAAEHIAEAVRLEASNRDGDTHEPGVVS